ANAEIDHEKIWMRGLVRHFESRRDRIRGVAGELRRPDTIRDGRRRDGKFVRERSGQKYRSFRNPEIRRPFLGFIYAAQERFVFVLGKIGVEPRTKLRI